MRFTLLAPVAALLAMLLCGPAQAGDTLEVLPGAKVVNAEAVAAGAKLIDARVASEYAEGHLKGAINVPYREKSAKAVDFDASQDEFDVSKLPTDKSAPIVIYCNGPECWKSFKASTAAIKAGHTNVLWYQAGFPDWKSKGLSVE